MLALNQRTFARAFNKAAAVKPAVNHIGTRYLVSRSDGSTATVKFTATPSGLWACCDCLAGSPAGRHLPLPCYHVAAAVLLTRQPRAEHKHKCTACGGLTMWSCNCLTPDTPDYDCDCTDALADTHRDSDYWV